jgi:hypothetical protein
MPFSSQLVLFHLRDASPTTRNFRSLIEPVGDRSKGLTIASP